MLNKLLKLSFAAAMLCLCLLPGCTDNDGDEYASRHSKPLMVVEKVDADFIVTVNDIVKAEIAAGEMAMSKGTDKRIKNFGRIMVKDYTRGLVKLKKLAAEKRIPLPDSLTIATKSKIAELEGKSGKDFDNAYIEYITADHKNAIVIFEQAQKNCFDKDVKAIARKGILAFKRHMEAIFAIRDSMHR